MITDLKIQHHGNKKLNYANQQNVIEQLIYIFSKLPGLGKRSSRRIVLHLLQDKEIRLKSLIDTLVSTYEFVKICQVCGNIDDNEICGICNNNYRDSKIIAIVESVSELWAIERSGTFNGKYHVLCKDMHSNHNNESEMRLPKLIQRCDEHKVEELIIATNPTLEGQTTAYVVTEYFKDYPIKISRLANGIPIGSELDYIDEGTLSLAINARKSFE